MEEEIEEELEWETKDGQSIPFSKLEDSHLLNIIKFVENRAENGMTKSIGGGGWDIEDMWFDETEIEGEEVLDYYNYKELIKEKNKRNI